ncbi:MAG TPA: HAD-IB family hydrolase [Gaiellaceae bacterium]|nr:HAD-IB family hydrolase [Gaiellaceae bacterium]
MSGAAFFDLDRTLLSRSSSLALAGTFRKRGLIGRPQLAKAALAQLVFARFGAGQARVGRTANRAMTILQGLSVEVMHEIVEEAWEPVLRPLVYREAVDLAAEHTGRGEPVFIVSAALYEVVETIAQKLGLAGALASRAEVDDGVYTGRLERRLYGPEKATALVELTTAEGLELASSTAYSDSHSDLPFLEAVGHPVVVNPDRALARVARARDWPVRRFRHRLGRP